MLTWWSGLAVLEDVEIDTQDNSPSQAEAPADNGLPVADAAAVETQFQATLHNQQEVAAVLGKKRLNWVIFRFISSWLASILVLFAIILLNNLEWARPKIQDAMSNSFHRQVKLGHLSWVLGLNGLAISTSKLWLIESSGKPFILSGKSEIGVAFTPLFSRQVIIKHVEFRDTEVFATQLAPGKWNFSDLLVEGPEIRFVQVEHGRLHLRNELTESQLVGQSPKGPFGNTAWRSYDFEDVNLKLIFPRRVQKRPWPFYLSFKLPRDANGKKYTTDFSLTMLNNGALDGWTSRKSNIELRAEHFNPNDWRPFMRIPDGFNGLLSFDFKGEGKIDTGIAGDINYKVKDISFFNNKEKIFSAPEAAGVAKIEIKGNEASWSKTTISMGGIKLETEGHLCDLDKPKPSYTAVVSANLENLAALTDTSFGQMFPGAGSAKHGLSGSAVVTVEFEGKGDEQHVFTSLKANNVPLANLLTPGTAGGAPLLSLFQIEPDAPIKGQIAIEADGRILLHDVRIPAKGSTLIIRGFVDAKKHQHDVFLEASDLSLDRFDTAELSGKKVKGSPSGQLMLSGKVDFKAHLTSDKKQAVDLNAQLRHASISTAKSQVLARDLVGDIRFDGTTIRFAAIKGYLANQGKQGSALQLNGTLQTNAGGASNLEISGQAVDIGQLLAFAQAAHLPVPSKATNNIHGLARDLNIRLFGKADRPQMTMNLMPADIRYDLKGPASSTVKAVRATGGSVTLADNVLELKNVEVSLGASKLIVTASGETKGEAVMPKLVHVRSRAVEINEIVQFLRTDVVPEPFRKNLSNAFLALKAQSIQGKAYGDLTVRMKEKAPHFVEGVVGLTNVSGKLGESTPFDHLSGLLAFSGDDVSLKDMMVQSAGGRFTFNGEINGLQQSPTWSVQFNGRARGRDLQQIIPTQASAAGIEMSSQAPVVVHGSVSDDGRATTGTFSLKAAVGDQFTFKSDALGLQQPAGEPMTIEGSIAASHVGTNQSFDLNSFHIALGEAVIKGSARWTAEEGHKPLLDFIISMPRPVPTAIAVGALMPFIDPTGSTGTVKGDFAASGEPGRLLTHGDLYLSKVSIPAMNLKDVDGKIDSPRWLVSADGAAEKGSSEMRVVLPHALIGGVDTRDFRATLKVDSGGESRISLKDGTAAVAGGRVSMNGYYLPPNAKWRLELSLDKLQVDQFAADMIEPSGELSGLADGKIVLSSTANGDTIANLTGNGKLSIYKGNAPRLGQLHGKLSASNLLQQGIFGFNLNNVLRSVVPVKTGQFREVSVNFDIDNGVVNIDRLNFDGNDLRLRAAGEWNLSNDSLALDVAGNIPRVASSILPGAVGEATRFLTLQKAIRVMTFRKLENLPSFPILGDIGTDDPRAFTFKVAAASTSPDAVSKSIEKSFKWLPNKPNASAHPIPGL